MGNVMWEVGVGRREVGVRSSEGSYVMLCGED